MERRHRRHRRRASRRADPLGGTDERAGTTRRSTSPTATCSGGAGCGRRSPRTSGWSGRASRGNPARWRQAWPAWRTSGASIASRHRLVEPDLSRVASWWHTDGDLGRNIEVLTDMNKSRKAGFTAHPRHPRQLLRLRRAVPRGADHPVSHAGRALPLLSSMCALIGATRDGDAASSASTASSMPKRWVTIGGQVDAAVGQEPQGLRPHAG